MQKHLFLTGKTGCGKSLAIRETLGDRLQTAGGFVSETMLDPGGAALCRSLLPAAAAGGVEGFEPLPYLDLRCVPPMHDNEVLRTEGVRLLRESAWYPYAVLDPIGSFELLIPQFRAALAELLNSEVPTVGVLLPQKEAEAVCSRLGLGERVKLNIAQLWKALRADPDTLILDASGLHRKRTLRLLETWAEEYAG